MVYLVPTEQGIKKTQKPLQAEMDFSEQKGKKPFKTALQIRMNRKRILTIKREYTQHQVFLISIEDLSAEF